MKLHWQWNSVYFSYRSDLTFVVGAQKSNLIETVLLSTHNNMFWF